MSEMTTGLSKEKIWGYSSAGRAPALQAGGLRFDPAYLHQQPKRVENKVKTNKSFLSNQFASQIGCIRFGKNQTVKWAYSSAG